MQIKRNLTAVEEFLRGLAAHCRCIENTGAKHL